MLSVREAEILQSTEEDRSVKMNILTMILSIAGTFVATVDDMVNILLKIYPVTSEFPNKNYSRTFFSCVCLPSSKFRNTFRLDRFTHLHDKTVFQMSVFVGMSTNLCGSIRHCMSQ